MSEHKLLDAAADVLPVGLQPTPFGEVWQALQQVAAQVWDVDPSVYRAGIAWMWYALRNPEALASDGLRALLVAALISEQAPLVKDTQTVAELAEYLRMWRDYTPTYPKLEALYSVFAARVEVRPISDAESQGVVPVADRRLAFYLRVESFDPARALSLDEVYQIAVRATPLGSRPVPYFALVGSSDVFVGPASAGVVRALWASEPAEPVTPPTPAYTEITLYLESGSKYCQDSITSGFTGNVNSVYCYQLYTNEQRTTMWNGYDYSNDYELGYYENGVWKSYIDSISEMPDEVGSTTDFIGYILMDTGCLWIVTNAYFLASTAVSSITLRIYPKGQQYYAAYFQTANAYTNNNFTTTDKVVYFAPNRGGSARFYGHYIADNGALVEVLGSAGNSVMRNTDALGASSVSGNSYLRMHQPQSSSREARCLVFSLPNRTFVGWVNLGGGNTSVSSGALVRLKDANGNAISYESNVKYTAVSFLATNDGIGAEALYDGRYGIGSDDTYPGVLCVKQVYGSISINRIWIAMEQVTDSIWAYFTNGGSSSRTNTQQTSGQSYLLYDENGNPIIYDPTKSYETLELQYIASGKYLMRGHLGFSSFVASANNQLQCTATLTNSIGVNRVRVWIK